MSSDKRDKQPKPGPDADRLKIEGDWESAVGKAIKKPRPADGWPKPDAAATAEKEPAQKKGRRD